MFKKKAENVTIIVPTHKPDEEFLKKIEKSIKEQDFAGKKEVIIVRNKATAEGINWGIKKSQTDIVITLHQDCLPSSKDWLRKLVEPFKDKKIVCSVSDVELPEDYWKKFPLMGRIVSAKERKVIRPLMDEKGCAYRKDVFQKIGFFGESKYRTAGEDFDIYIKLKKEGEVVYPGCKVLHYHWHSFDNRIKKELQLAEGFGALVRNLGKEMPKWHIGFLKALPLIGLPIFFLNFPYRKFPILGLAWLPLSILFHFLYVIGFWKGFFQGEQRI